NTAWCVLKSHPFTTFRAGSANRWKSGHGFDKLYPRVSTSSTKGFRQALPKDFDTVRAASNGGISEATA
ncbi:MAG: hypothetical protein C0393_03120, partial [Anaerolinea sp.]|nr:hypothetical protein [Anaerolinea sp.]